MIKRRLTYSTLSLLVCVLISLFLVFEKSLTEAALDAIHLSVLHVIPSLFPYMVLTSFTVSLGLLDPICALIPTKRLFRLPRESATVIVTGIIGGFPTGALGACKMYERGVLTRDEASRLCAISSVASPAFIIGTVGALLGRDYAFFLLGAQTVTSVIIATVLARRKNEVSPSVPVSVCRPSPIGALCTAITEGASSSVSICGYIVFFRVIAALIGEILPPIRELASAVLEFSSGAVSGAAHGGIIGIATTGFSVGFAGVSVFMQIANIISRHKIPIAPILITKLIQGGILSALSAVYFTVHSPVSATVTVCTRDHHTHAITAVILIASVCFAIYRKYFSRRS